MTRIESAWNNLRTLDELAFKKSIIHRLNPGVKLLTTLAFILAVASFHNYDLEALMPLFLYPLVLITLAELPAGYLIKRILIITPFILFIAIFNPLFDRTPLIQIGALSISGGWISFVSILVRMTLTVLAALILIATTGLNDIGAALLKIKVPGIFVIQLLFLYRYLSVLIEETVRILRAHSLRSLVGKGLGYKVWGSLIGQLLLKTVDRAQRIYQAMLCRGFKGEIHFSHPHKAGFIDILYLLGWSGFFIIVRLYNIPQLIGAVFMGAGR